jgi:nitrite reductase/ring-hydroxylating ferredoxin subunit/uncharacterized membrane protein
MRSPGHETVTVRLERFDALDPISEPLQKAVRAAVPTGTPVKDALSGTWLGHPLHPPLTDVVIGAWTSALLLDLAGGSRSREASDRLILAGVLAAVPTAAAGLSDWAELHGGTRRLGSVHAIGNTTAIALHAASWFARHRGRRRRGIALSALGYGIATFSAWLGGHLSFAAGVGVNQSAFEEGPSDWVAIADERRLEPGRLVGASTDGVAVVLVRHGETVHALADRCSHRGCPLHEGKLVGDAIVCPCHGSAFNLDGSVAHGPATSPQRRFDVRVRAGKVEVKAAEPS